MVCSPHCSGSRFRGRTPVHFAWTPYDDPDSVLHNLPVAVVRQIPVVEAQTQTQTQTNPDGGRCPRTFQFRVSLNAAASRICGYTTREYVELFDSAPFAFKVFHPSDWATALLFEQTSLELARPLHGARSLLTAAALAPEYAPARLPTPNSTHSGAGAGGNEGGCCSSASLAADCGHLQAQPRCCGALKHIFAQTHSGRCSQSHSPAGPADGKAADSKAFLNKAAADEQAHAKCADNDQVKGTAKASATVAGAVSGHMRSGCAAHPAAGDCTSVLSGVDPSEMRRSAMAVPLNNGSNDNSAGSDSGSGLGGGTRVPLLSLRTAYQLWHGRSHATALDKTSTSSANCCSHSPIRGSKHLQTHPPMPQPSPATQSHPPSAVSVDDHKRSVALRWQQPGVSEAVAIVQVVQNGGALVPVICTTKVSFVLSDRSETSAAPASASAAASNPATNTDSGAVYLPVIEMVWMPLIDHVAGPAGSLRCTAAKHK